ncbi:MAG: Aldehyde dehydrogenase, partial [uncultured Nocardioides sp.]
GAHRRQEDLQALRRRAVPALGVRPVLRRQRRGRHLPGQRRPGLAQGRPRRRPGGPQGLRRLVGPHRLQPRAGHLPHRRGPRGPPGPVRRRAPCQRGPHGSRRRHLRRRGRRPAGLVRRVGGQGHPGRRQRQPGGRPLLQPLLPRAQRRRRRGRADRTPARPRERRRPGDRDRQHLRGGRQRGAPAHRDHPRRGHGDLGPARRRGQRADRLRRRGGALAGLPHGRQRDRPHRGGRRRPRRGPRGRRRRQPQARTTPRRAHRLAGRARHRPDDRLARDEDGLAPGGHL